MYKYIKLLFITLTVFTINFVSLSDVKAISINNLSNLDNQLINVNGLNYVVSIKNESNKTISVVTDEQGISAKAILNKDTGKLTINGNEILIVEFEESTNNLTRSANKVLSRKTYTISGGVTSFAALISAFVSGNLWGKAIKITITEYRSGSKYTSGKYKYWTNVLAKCGSSSILNQNHSVY